MRHVAFPTVLLLVAVLVGCGSTGPNGGLSDGGHAGAAGTTAAGGGGAGAAGGVAGSAGVGVADAGVAGADAPVEPPSDGSSPQDGPGDDTSDAHSADAVPAPSDAGAEAAVDVGGTADAADVAVTSDAADVAVTSHAADVAVTSDAATEAGVDASATSDARAEAGLDASSEKASDAPGEGAADGPAVGFTTVFTIVLESADYGSVVGNTVAAPYLNSLIATYGLATNYMDSGVHPSLPNNLYLVSGATQYPGIVDVDPAQAPYFPAKQDNLGAQLTAAQVAWRSYQESAGAPCKLSSAGNYAPKHDPFLYFDDIQNGPDQLCARTNVDYSSFAADLTAGTYRFMWITPNMVDAGLNGGLANADGWCSREIPKILNSQVYKDGGVIFVTWDQAVGVGGASPDHVPMIVISPRLKAGGYRTAVAYTHASYLATVETIFKLPLLGDAALPATKTLLELFQ
jgi:hypothetical protein